MQQRITSVFVTHGGGPLPLLGHASNAAVAAAMRGLPAQLGLRERPPRAVLLVSAHFEADQPTLLASPPPDLLFDYGGFPPESYKLQYRPPGAADVADEAARLLRQHGFKPAHAPLARGLDHGAFVPLMLMFPEADVPVVELSILSSYSEEAHLRMGEALAPLAQQGVLLLASGSSWHNIPLMFKHMSGPAAGAPLVGQPFEDWLAAACTQHAGAERAQLLARWRAAAPGAAEAHPTPDHLMPLLVAAGAAGGAPGAAQRLSMGGVAVSNYCFGAGAAEALASSSV